MRLLNALKTHAASMDAGAPVGRWGVVTSADTNAMTVKVTLQPEGVQTDWLPLASSMVGGGWGLVHLPPVGTQVFCVPDAGDATSYVVIGATWSTASRPPAGVVQGETWLVHSTGSAIKLTNDGVVTVSAPAGVTINTPVATVSGVLTVGTGASGTFTSSTGSTITVRDGIITNIY